MSEMPVFPLNTVLFPGGRLPLRIFEQRYMSMAKRCLRDELPFGVCLIREGTEVGAPAIPVTVGCIARIATWDMPHLGLLHIMARGERRFRILSRSVQADGLSVAEVEPLPEDEDAPVPVHCQGCVRLLKQVIEQQPAHFEAPHRLSSASWVSARLAEVLPLPLSAKQELLELSDGLARLERLNNLLPH